MVEFLPCFQVSGTENGFPLRERYLNKTFLWCSVCARHHVEIWQKFSPCGFVAGSDLFGRRFFRGANFVFMKVNKHDISGAIPRASSHKIFILPSNNLWNSQRTECAASCPKKSLGDAVGCSGGSVLLFKDFGVLLKLQKGTTFRHSFWSSNVNEVLPDDLQIHGYFPSVCWWWCPS